jgi:hypothetical protein
MGAAVRRWAVADGPVVVAAVVWAAGRRGRGPLTAALLAGAAAVRIPVATDIWRRGVHDLAAGTVVTRPGRSGTLTNADRDTNVDGRNVS